MQGDAIWSSAPNIRSRNGVRLVPLIGSINSSRGPSPFSTRSVRRGVPGYWDRGPARGVRIDNEKMKDARNAPTKHRPRYAEDDSYAARRLFVHCSSGDSRFAAGSRQPHRGHRSSRPTSRWRDHPKSATDFARGMPAGCEDGGTAAETCNGSANPPANSFFASADPRHPPTGSAISPRRPWSVYTSTGRSRPIVPRDGHAAQ